MFRNPLVKFVEELEKAYYIFFGVAYSVNCDVAVDKTVKTNRRLGMGIIVRDHKGYVLTLKSLNKLENLEPITAEVLASLHASEFSRDMGLHKILLEGDAFKVMNDVTS